MGAEPAGEPHVGDARRVVGVIVGEKLNVDPSDRYLELEEPDGGAAAGVDQEFLLAGLDQRARAEAVRARNRNAGSEQGDAKVRRAHELILMPASLMTLVQCAISPRISAPNCSGVPPPTSAPSLANDSRTFSVCSVLFSAAFRRATTAGGVPDFTRMPAQSSATRLG